MAFAAPLAAITMATGALVQGAATQNAADYQSAVASNNALEASRNAAYSTQAGRVQAEQKSRQGAEKQAAVKTAMAANGVDVNTGSAVTVQEGERENAVTDTDTTMHNAVLKAYGYRTQETNFQAESQLDKAKGEDAAIGSYFNATGDLLSGAKGFGGGGGSSVGSLFGDFGLPTSTGYASP